MINGKIYDKDENLIKDGTSNIYRNLAYLSHCQPKPLIDVSEDKFENIVELSQNDEIDKYGDIRDDLI